MAQTWAFNPLYKRSGTGGTNPNGVLVPSVTISASTSAASGTLPNSSTNQVQIANQTAAWCYVNFGTTTTNIVAATVASSYPVAPGGVVVVTVDDEVGAASVILAAGGTAGSVTFTCGNGL
jgi:hypothetical protein